MPRSTRLQRPLFIRVRTPTGRVLKLKREYLIILDEAYVSKIAVLRETNLQDCNPAQKNLNRFQSRFYLIQVFLDNLISSCSTMNILCLFVCIQ